MKRFLSSLFSFMITSVLIGQTEKLWYEENFDRPTMTWFYSAVNTPEIEKKIDQGYLYINQKNTNVYYTHNSAKLDPKKDFKIEAKTNFLSSSTSGGFHILLFGEDSKNFYFGMNANTKVFWVGSEQKGTWETINEHPAENHSVSHSAIKGLNEDNILSLELHGNDLIFSINNEKVYAAAFDQKFKELKNKIEYHGFGTSMEGVCKTDYYRIYQNNPINLLTDKKLGLYKEKLSSEINSSVSDRTPVISPDGKTLYFIRGGNSANFGGTDNDDIWVSNLKGDSIWELAQCYGVPINNKSPNSVISISPDNNTMVLMHTYNEDGSFKSAGISVSNRTSNSWSVPKNLEIKNYYNDGSSNEFCFSTDMKIFISAIKRKETIGSNDLYVSFLNEDGTYSEPKNMGAVINSAGWELSPFLAADGKTLYFGSDGHPGYGSSDIYVSKRLDDTWTNWSIPQNLGPEINSSFWEAYYSIPASGKYAYVVANDGVSDDLYRIKLPSEFKPDPVVLISGVVYNSKTKKPMDASILFSDIKTNKYPGTARTEPNTGAYKINLPAGKVYQFLGQQAGFYPSAENIDLMKLKDYTEIKKDLYLSPIEIGQTVRLNNLFFDFGKANIKSDSESELDRVIQFLNENPLIKIEISGHTDHIGEDAFNLKLSQMRMDAVIKYLIENKVNLAQIKGVGYGESKPIESNATEQGRAANRRVEFIIIEK